MSSLLRRLQDHYARGFAGDPPELFSDYRIQPGETFRPAAVLMAMTDRPTEPGFLLLHRPSNMRAHPGQIAFPGGKVDQGEGPVEAALREAWEELGIRRNEVSIIGQSDIYKTGSGYEITPVLAMVPPDVEINPSPTEVAQWFEAPADFVLDPANQIERWAEWEGGMRPYYEIQWREHCIWGVTAAILVNLSRRLQWLG